MNIPQVKVCGLTDVNQALKCVELGANAIGCVFFSKSPRNLDKKQAKKICLALPSEVISVGVFVNETFSFIMEKVKYCGLKAVQLHGQESPELVDQLCRENLMVIKGLFISRIPSMEQAEKFNASAFLVECGQGKLPGGNAKTWNWNLAKNFGNNYPFILAGGLNSDNIVQAVDKSQPDAVDISSGVESVPGQKDVAKVKAFMDNLSKCSINKKIRKIF